MECFVRVPVFLRNAKDLAVKRIWYSFQCIKGINIDVLQSILLFHTYKRVDSKCRLKNVARSAPGHKRSFLTGEVLTRMRNMVLEHSAACRAGREILKSPGRLQRNLGVPVACCEVQMYEIRYGMDSVTR